MELRAGIVFFRSCMSEQDPEEILDGMEQDGGEQADGQLGSVLPVSAQYRNWFLDYASYVILERAIPAMEDGLKPVQRRILHAMYEMDDGRFNKVANIIGATMAYHPHGDAAIGDALVNMGQKDLLIDTQGNWGDVRTGDSAAAPRYIEARLSHFAKEVAFNEKTTLPLVSAPKFCLIIF
jgi:topoisomerase-4 subunit A